MLSAEDGVLVNDAATTRFDFGTIAARYDAWYQKPRGAMYDRLEKRAIDSLLPAASDGDKLLEIGCGTGHFSAHFAHKGFAVTGVDVSEAMVAVARQKNIKNSGFQVADAEHLPFKDKIFDVVAAITALEFVSDPVKVVSEMVRCVKQPGGALIFGVLNRLSAYNRSKQRKGTTMYASAKLFAPGELRDLLRPFGTLTVQIAGFVPRQGALVWLSPLLEYMGRLTGNRHGAFLAASVSL